MVFEFTTDSTGNYRQNPVDVTFDGGTFDMDVRDGEAFFDGCHSFLFYTPSPICPLGATGYISRGIDNDPLLRGRGPYFSITGISSASVLKPFDANAARLNSAPPSLLPRPLGGFTDLSLSVFYNLQTPLIRQYFISRYSFTRGYTAADRSLFDGEIVPGTYIYNFASIINPTKPVVLTINQFPKLDGYRKINSQRQGLRFLNLTYDDGFAVLNPFDLNVVSWEGNVNNLIAPGVDNLFFSIKPLADPTDPLSDPVQYDGQGPFLPDGSPNPTVAIFPNFVGSSASRVLLPSPLDTSYIIPPNFIDPGQTGIIDLELAIFRPTSPVAYENSTRRFRLPVKVINPFFGAIAAALPANATAAERAADYDFDGDGFSNFAEWTFGSNPADRNSTPGSPGVKVVSSTGTPATRMAADETSSSALQYSVTKLTNPVPKLKYTIEYSKDMNTWQTVSAGNPSWVVTETAKELKVTGSGTNQDVGGFFRTKVVPLN
ncbi:hypothetical protein HZ994_12045 [Akkermansiaceae bacterium]|nr:hypothetical protein HZ994_12045 [Akkermansiaceae bacterium]